MEARASQPHRIRFLRALSFRHSSFQGAVAERPHQRVPAPAAARLVSQIKPSSRDLSNVAPGASREKLPTSTPCCSCSATRTRCRPWNTGGRRTSVSSGVAGGDHAAFGSCRVGARTSFAGVVIRRSPRGAGGPLSRAKRPGRAGMRGYSRGANSASPMLLND